MTAYLLDTNHISPLVTIEHPLRQRILEQLVLGDIFAISTPALSEFLFGIGSLPKAKRNLREWERLKADFSYYRLNESDAAQSAKLRLMLRGQGWQLGIIDAFIAVTALRNDLVLLTTDRDFQAVPDLKYENWRDT